MSLRVGAAFFNDPKNYNPHHDCDGYRSVSGETGMTISRTGDLPSDTCWLTNVMFDRRRETRLNLNPGVYGDSYLRSKVSSLLLELGANNLPIVEQADLLATIFSRVVTMGEQIWGISELPANSYARGITSALGHYQPLQSAAITDIAQSAVQPYSACQAVRPPEAIYTSAVMPRFEHCDSILKSGLPWGAFEEVSASKLPSPQNRLSWLKEQGVAYMAEVTITRMAPMFSALFNNGAGAGLRAGNTANGSTFAANNQRHVLTKPELDSLSRVADLEIERAWVCDEPPRVSFEIPLRDQKMRIGFSYGLLCENLWCSLAYDQTGSWARTPLTAWLYALDRMLCLERASKLSQLGIAVLGFGTGRINVALSRDQVKDFPKFCADVGLIPPISVNPEGLDLELPQSPSIEQMVINLHASNQIEALMKFDQKVTESVVNKS